MRNVTSADVARDSGVSRTTVSYVLNDTPGAAISEETRARVRASAERLGYTPSAAARTLRTGRSDLVLYVLPDWPLGPAVDTLLDHLAGELAERGLSLLVHHVRGGRPLSELWRAVTPRAVVGFTAFTRADREAMQRAGIQVLGTLLDDEPGAAGAFSASQRAIGRLQARHLHHSGHPVIGYAAATDPRVREFVELRLAGVREACADAGLPEPVVEPVDLTVDSAVGAVRGWRRHSPQVSAVAAYNDDVAIAVLSGLRADGLRVPDDVAVIGVDDVPAAQFTVPPLTTVSQSLELQARHLAAVVVAGLEGGDAAPPPLLGDLLDVVVRESA
ncbi:LacI family DNA-binding transcriptional regulator [Knoellia sp. 3-2P3]|uniref:LacI family DNA-binding transcriptional regulator n=1 Tax=unclassified Knoellia TaxID=2618719 RepID=UPI0023DABBF2|nr:LacI family DNA-binding transcriptional regulator [Knoellia sp. 3-2P3]MDF2091257.1 LacI family DNA-binding transcriptional regulator [Knoellia sp. 3-2P3]